ncbi:MAG: hypothetical protein Q7U77_11320 [Sediminibacterium sp.]|uniref:hypothetical protein n=1 Tax=Sediminibacterium sp. TaxID=1917865 RepID=UPI00271A06D9|nr:hypothetical protein [Sediminibacterium sp.]MDO8997208.1 hypothetical protein [Sediminibacterium sp.]
MTTTTTPPPAPVQENLLKLNKAELQAEYKKVIGSEPDPALTKDELANEIKAALEKVVPTNPNEGNDPGDEQQENSNTSADSGTEQSNGEKQGEAKASENNTTIPPTTTTPPPAPVQEKMIPDGSVKVVKIIEGKVVDTNVMTQRAWDNLPVHKYGWSIDKPKELQ